MGHIELLEHPRPGKHLFLHIRVAIREQLLGPLVHLRANLQHRCVPFVVQFPGLLLELRLGHLEQLAGHLKHHNLQLTKIS